MAALHFAAYLERLGIHDLNTPPSDDVWQACLHLLDRVLSEQAMLNTLFEQTNDSVAIFTLEGCCIKANPQAAKMLGYDSPEELIQSPVIHWITPECLSQMMDAFQRAAVGETIPRFECVLRRKNGDSFPCEINLQVSRDEDGQARWVQSIMRDTTHRKTIESALRQESQSRQEHETRLQLINDAMTDLVCQISADGIVEYVSSSIMRVLGRNVDYWLGKSALVLLESIHPDDRTQMLDVFQSTFGNPTETVVRYRYQHADGHYVWFESTGRSVEDLNGRWSIVFVSRDITHQKIAEEALREQEVRLKLITNHIEDVVLLIGLDGLTHYVSPSFRLVLGHDPAEYVGRGAEALGQIIQPEELYRVGEAIQQVIATGHSQKREFRVRRADGEYIDMEAMYSLVLREGHVEGVLSVSRDITARKAAETVLQEREAQLRLITDNMADAVSAFDLNGITRYVSPSIKAITGFTPEQLIGQTLVMRGENMHLDDLPATAVVIQQVYATHQSHKAEYRARRADDTYVWLESIFSPLLKDNELVGFASTTRDISQRKQAEIMLREQEERLQLTLHAAKAGSWEWNLRTYSTRWSDQEFVLLGLSPNVFIPTLEKWMACIHPDDLENLFNQYNNAIQNEEICDQEYRVIWPDGSIHWMHDMSQSWHDRNGVPERIIGITMDITARKQAEIALREQEERLQLALQAAKAGAWESALATQDTHWSDQEYALMGRSRADYTPTQDWWETCVHPDDREQVVTNYFNAIVNHVNGDQEYRVVWPDGSIHWLHDLSQAQYDRGGVAERIVGISMDITERKGAQEALRQSEERLQLALHAAKAVAWEADLVSQVRHWSDQEYALMGRSRADYMPTMDWWTDCIHPDDREKVITRYYEAILNRVNCDQEYRVVWPDGSIHWLHDMSQARYGADGVPKWLAGITMDITERKGAQEALRQSEERLRLITDAMSDSVGQVDANGRLRYMSRAFEAWIGIDASTLMQEEVLDWSKFIHPDDLGQMATLFSTLADSDHPVRVEHRVQAADGSVLWLETVANVLHEADGSFGGAIFVSRNIEERRQAERNALELVAERKLVAALRNILSNISHDFRTPISVINSSMYLLRRKAGEDFVGLRHLIAIEDQTERMANMVETMFTLSSLDDEDYKLVPVEIIGLMQNILIRRSESADRKKLSLVNNMPPAPIFVNAEPTMLSRALENIVINALQYTPTDGSITVRGHRQADRMVIEVVDTGIGISAADLPHIFESFYRADKARNIDHGSTGLGLTIAQRIIQYHDGMIEVESEPGVGSTFRIILPLLPLAHKRA